MQAQEKMFDVGLYITVYADNNNDLFKTENEIKSLLESKLIYLKPALFQQEEAFKSVIHSRENTLARKYDMFMVGPSLTHQKATVGSPRSCLASDKRVVK